MLSESCYCKLSEICYLELLQNLRHSYFESSPHLIWGFCISSKSILTKSWIWEKPILNLTYCLGRWRNYWLWIGKHWGISNWALLSIKLFCQTRAHLGISYVMQISTQRTLFACLKHVLMASGKGHLQYITGSSTQTKAEVSFISTFRQATQPTSHPPIQPPVNVLGRCNPSPVNKG